MLRIAGGEPLGIEQAEVQRRGHAIECRINAENPAQKFAPVAGQITALEVPEGEGIRFDTMLYEGYTVPPFYDSLLGKLIVWGETRDAARARLQDALAGLRVEGVFTTIPLHKALAADPDVAAHRYHTRWLEAWLDAHAAFLAVTRGGTWGMKTRYSFGGDEHVFVECDEEMSLGGVLQEPLDHQCGARRQDRGRDGNLSRQRVAADQVRSRRDRARRHDGRVKRSRPRPARRRR